MHMDMWDRGVWWMHMNMWDGVGVVDAHEDRRQSPDLGIQTAASCLI